MTSLDQGSELRGSMTAMVTPFRNGDIDRPAFAELIERQIEAGTDWLVVCGTTGESPTLSPDEHRELVSLAVEASGGRRPVMAGTGTNCTRESIRRTREAIDLGIDAALLVTPYYNRPSPEGLYRHYAAIAEAVDIPLVLYNVPARTGTNMPMDVVIRLHRAYPHIAALKHATGSVDGVTEIRDRCDIAILSGDDAITFPLMALGAVGVISVVSNLIPLRMKALVDAALESRLDEARALHRRIARLAEGLARLGPNPVPIKAAMAEVGWIRNEVRLPLVTTDDREQAVIQELLRRFEILTPVLV
ncbi:MAG: 4-hydroxy-tetrahydrodipicolinate synthase [Phycisphaerae bacterium]|nr:4-hydroxy-tetrahydrodipicolinate synthase [Phycisphaerae bacterium]